MGFPSIGGVTDRPTVTLTRGIIAGFTRSPGGHVQIKTDAIIASGSSGGAAFDADWRLVGVPTMTVSEDLGGTDKPLDQSGRDVVTPGHVLRGQRPVVEARPHVLEVARLDEPRLVGEHMEA